MNTNAVQIIEHSKDGGIGVAKTIRTIGNGEKPAMGDKVVISYRGMLDDGHVFVDSHTKTNKSGELEITLGMREMFGTGGDLGIVSMRVGERALLTCHSEFACGVAGQGDAIPPNSRLTFDVTLHKNLKAAVLRETLWGMFGLLCFLIFVFGALYKTGNIWHGGKHGFDYRLGHGPL